MKIEPGQQCNNFKPQAQAILGFILVFIAVMVLVLGISRIWVWFNVNYAAKSSSYEQTRLHAGQPDTYQENNLKVTPLKLNEEWLFGGKVTDDNKVNPFGGVVGKNSLELAKECQNETCATDTACFLANGRFNILCPCYVKCMCLGKMDPYLTLLSKQATNFRTQAQSMTDGANKMREAAGKCSKFWQLCWWFGFGKSSKELKRGARQMDRAAKELGPKADETDKKREGLISCCELASIKEQEVCMDFVAVTCAEMVETFINTWDKELFGRDLYENEGTFNCDAGDTPIEYKTEKNYCDECSDGDDTLIHPCDTTRHDWSVTGNVIETCIYTCKNCWETCVIACWKDCGEHYMLTCYAIPSVKCVAVSGEKNTGLYAQKQYIEDSISQIGPTITNCANQAQQECQAQCAEAVNYNECYAGCYEEHRNNCCMASFDNCGRQCDIPVTGCDQDCVQEESGCPQCGLSELKKRLQDKLDNEINPRILELEGKIKDLRDKTCCDNTIYPKAKDQLKCIQEEVEK